MRPLAWEVLVPGLEGLGLKSLSLQGHFGDAGVRVRRSGRVSASGGLLEFLGAERSAPPVSRGWSLVVGVWLVGGLRWLGSGLVGVPECVP